MHKTARWLAVGLLAAWAIALDAGPALAVPAAPFSATPADYHAYWNARRMSWHAAYYYTQWGKPIGLVVPPTAHMQTKWGWGVGNEQMTPIYHQFQRPFPGEVAGSGNSPFLPTPPWPAHTDQFGVYYIRGPW